MQTLLNSFYDNPETHQLKLKELWDIEDRAEEQYGQHVGGDVVQVIGGDCAVMEVVGPTHRVVSNKPIFQIIFHSQCTSGW